MRENLKSGLLVFIILAIHNLAMAQEFVYQQFGVNDGLPSSQVYDVYQDAVGYIWFATDRGLSRYNGYEFKNYSTKDGLTSNVVLRFFPQNDGRVWCHSLYPQALFYFDESSDEFIPYQFNDILAAKLDRESLVKSLVVDSLESVHIGGYKILGEYVISKQGKSNENFKSLKVSKDRSLFFVEDHYGDHFSFQSYWGYHFENIPFIRVKNYQNFDAVNLEKSGKIVFTNSESISIFDKKTQTHNIVKTEKSPLKIGDLGDGRFMVGFLSGGVKIYNTEGEVLRSFLDNKTISNFLIDHEGGYWFSTINSGVYYVKNPNVELLNPTGILSNYTTSLAKNKSNDLFLGCSNGDILMKKGKGFEFIYESSQTNHSFVESNPKSDNIIYYCNESIGNGNVRQNIRYSTKISEKAGDIFIASGPSHYTAINSSGFIEFIRYPSIRVKDVCYWQEETYLASTEGIIKKERDSFVPLKEKSPLLTYRTEDMDADENKIYMATHGAGMVIYGDTIFNIAQRDGLYSDIVDEILIENETTVWVCTNKGLNKVVFNDQGHNYKISGISNNDGIISNEIEDIEIIDDTIYLATKEGLCVFPKTMLDSRPISNNFFRIQEVLVNGERQSLEGQKDFEPDENRITFFVEGVSYFLHNNLVYQHRLLGADTSWTRTKNRKIDYSSLSPGRYTFEAMICDDRKNCYNEAMRYSFTISPPIWHTWWFRFMIFFLLGGLIYWFFRIRIFSYNRDIMRELLRLLVKRIRKKENYLIIRESGKDLKLVTNSIIYIQSSGNYIDIVTESGTHIVREKLSAFMDLVPDPIEFIRIHRSYIVRIDKVVAKSKNEVVLREMSLPVSKRYSAELKKILIQ